MENDQSASFPSDIKCLVDQLNRIAESLTNGLYSVRLNVKSKDPAFLQLQKSLNQILELIELNTNITLIGENSLINDFINVFSSFASREFTKKIEISDNATILDAIGVGINMLGEELEISTVSRLELETERNRLNNSQEIAKLGDWEYYPTEKRFVCSPTFYKILEVENQPADNLLKIFDEKIIFADNCRTKDVIDRLLVEPNFNIEAKFIDRNKNTKHLYNYLSQIRNDKGSVIGYAGVVQDVTPLKTSQEQLSHQINLQKLITEISSGFINNKAGVRIMIEDALRICCDFFLADRAFFLKFNGMSVDKLEIFEYNTQSVSYSTNSLFEESPQLFDICLATVKANQVVQCHNIESIPIKEEKEMLIRKNVKSFITLPVYGDEHEFAIFGMDCILEPRSWSEEEINGLKIISNIISDVLHRDYFEKKLIIAREKAEESDRLKTAFLMNMSHEIRTPMNGILGFLPLLEEPNLAEEEKQYYIDIVNQSGLRLLDTINDIIEISRIEAGENEVIYQTVDLCEVLSYHVNFFEHQAKSKGLMLRLVQQLPYEKCLIMSDKNKLYSILTNLIKNAIKFTENGSIELGAYLDANALVIFVKDTGIGIPLDRQEAIFERFVQADIKLTRAHEGSGLGLAIAKAYAQSLKGTIRVESSPGIGSNFILQIPYLGIKSQEPQNQDIVEKKFHESEDITILIAEDDIASFEFLRIILSKKKYKLIHTFNGEDTVKEFIENPDVSLILMDIKMPGMDGLEATRSIRKIDDSIPIIAQTAHAFSGEKERAFEAGCNDYITKPIKRSDLIFKIEKLLS